MQLLNEDWLPVRLRSGAQRWIKPSELSDPEIVAFDANRADFNGALAQFAIGLLQTTAAVSGNSAWRKFYHKPPDSSTLEQWFAPVAAAFELDGTAARFMQDLDLTLADGSVSEISALLIESPGENALRNNTDHFIKRARCAGMCPHCAATALFTLQTNAPSGGVGHRTGLRGGGPLTTLIMSERGQSLWHDLWLNVMDDAAFCALGGDAEKDAAHFTFPWLASLSRLQKEGAETAPIQVHPAHVYWAMPRRIRLDFDQLGSGTCGICNRSSTQLVTQYVSKNYGMNYKGAWNHPLSPYYKLKEERLPLHPQPGGLGYRHWLAWVLGMQNEKKQQYAAAVVTHALTHRKDQIQGALRLWAFGYDMDNMKPRCWYEASLPLYGLANCAPEQQNAVALALEVEVSYWLKAAELALSMLRGAIKDAWFSRDARGDFSHIDAAFWSATEAGFYRQLRDVIEAKQQSSETTRRHWVELLRQHALRLFDEVFVGAGPIQNQHPARVAQAWQHLLHYLSGPKMMEAAGLPSNVPAAKAKKTSKSSPAVA